YYMVFLVNSSGVPSTAQFVQLNPPLTINPPSQGDNSSRTAAYTVTVTDRAAFGGGCVTLSASGVANARPSVAAQPHCTGQDSTTMTITDTTSTPGGAYTVAVTGTNGSISHPARTGMFIGDFGISVSPASQNVNAGSQTTFTVTVSSLRSFNGP